MHRPPPPVSSRCHPHACPDCDGTGDAYEDSMILYGIPGGSDVSGPCDTCQGTGINRAAAPLRYWRAFRHIWLAVNQPDGPVHNVDNTHGRR